MLNKQRQFIADAAHELRTPLTAVSLQAQIAERTNVPEKRSFQHRAAIILSDGKSGKGLNVNICFQVLP